MQCPFCFRGRDRVPSPGASHALPVSNVLRLHLCCPMPFGSLCLVAAQVHRLEGAEVMAAGGYWGDVVSRRAEWIWELQCLVDRQTAAGADKPVAG